MKFNTDINTLSLCPVPPSTDTYTAVPHLDIHNKVIEVLAKKGIEINYTQFKSNRSGTQVIVTYHLDMGNGEFGGMLAWRNSYDKTRSVAICAGATVYICGNGAVMGEMKFIKRHVGEVNEQLEDAIDEQLNKVEDMIEKTAALKNALNQKAYDKYLAGAVIGNLYLNGVLNTTQLEIVTRELNEPSFVYGVEPDSMWALFNHVTHALKTSAPSNYFENHLGAIKFFNLFT